VPISLAKVESAPVPPPDLAQAIPCSINKGVLDEQGNKVLPPAQIYVDEALVLATSRACMEQVLATLIKAIFIVMGEPDTDLHQCPLAMDKWSELIIGPKKIMLGLVINTNRVTVGIPVNYIQGVCSLIDSTLHVACHCFTVQEAQELTRKLGRLAEGVNWVFHLLTHLYTSIANALSENKRFLADLSAKFKLIIKLQQTECFSCSMKDQVRHILFAMKQSAEMIHRTRLQYNINQTMHQEIEFFCEKLRPDSGIQWEAPIAHIIPRRPTCITFGYSCLNGAGGYSLSLGFWRHLTFPHDIIIWTLLHKKCNNLDGCLISNNVLEFITVISNYCAAQHVILASKVTEDPHPVLLNVTSNASALSWTTGACQKSKLSRLLACFFCSLLFNLPLGINSKWISTLDNVIDNDISCTKAELKHIYGSHPSFDYLTLKQKYPELNHCSFFYPAPELISLILEILLTGKWPCHKELKKLRLKPIGRLPTSSGAP
jgi:hypothetical protein